MATAREVQVWITIGTQVYEVCERIYGKVSEWLAPDLAIDCPHCGESQTYDLGTLKKGWFSRYFHCSDCGKKIKVEIQVEVS